MRVKILIKYPNENYAQFEFRINLKIKELEKDFSKVLGVDISNDGKQIIAIIKYN